MARAIYEEYDLLPIVKIGENIVLRTPSGKEKYFQVTRVEAIPIIRDDFKNYIEGFTQLDPNTPPATVKADVTKQILAVENYQLFQFRIYPVDDYEYRYTQSGPRYRLKNKEAWISKYTAEKFPNQLEFFVYEDNTPEVDIRNPTNYPLTELRFDLVGFLYDLTELQVKPEKATYIPIYVEI